MPCFPSRNKILALARKNYVTAFNFSISVHFLASFTLSQIFFHGFASSGRKSILNNTQFYCKFSFLDQFIRLQRSFLQSGFFDHHKTLHGYYWIILQCNWGLHFASILDALTQEIWNSLTLFSLTTPSFYSFFSRYLNLMYLHFLKK